MAGASQKSPSKPGLAGDLAAVHSAIMGHLELSPKFVRKFAVKECLDKPLDETYEDYCKRLQGEEFTKSKWRKWCNFSWRKFEKATNPNDMDVTALGHLFQALFKTKNDSRDYSSFMEKLQHVKDLRNAVMHDINETLNSAALDKLKAALDDFIQEGGRFYGLSDEELDGIQNELTVDIQAGFSTERKKLLYAKTRMINEKQTTMKRFLQLFESVDLMFSTSKVNREAIFYHLEVFVRKGKKSETLSYSKIFEHSENFIIVSGAAGAGKSTLLENIALQFAKPKLGISTRLEDFQLLVYIQCRDHTTKTLSHVMIQHFPDVRTDLGEDMVLEALFNLQVLFLVDGYDEYQGSMTVLQEMFKNAQLKTNCQVIITSRPHAVKQLEQLLSRDNINFATFEIAPLSELEQQLNFLRKYEPYLPGLRPSGVVRESFEILREPIRRAFTEPHRLLQFCFVFITHPDQINQWKRMNDVAEDIYAIYETCAAQKIANTSYANIDSIIRNFFLVICETALDCLRANTLALTKDHFDEVLRKCSVKLRAEHAFEDKDLELLLSCVFKRQKSFTGKGERIYSFTHKSDQEYFASKCVLEKLCTSDASVKDILIGRKPQKVVRFMEVLEYVICDMSSSDREKLQEIWPALKKALLEEGDDVNTWKDLIVKQADDSQLVKRAAEIPCKTAQFMEYRQKQREKRFLEVIEYVIKNLSTSGTLVLRQRWSELKEALLEEGADFNTWKGLALSCACNLDVVKGASQAAGDQNQEWNVESGRDMEAVVLMLSHAQPHVLKVKMSTAALRKTKWTKVLQLVKAEVQLWLQLSSDESSDDMLEPLHDTKCRLGFYEGTLTTHTGVSALASVASEMTVLNIWLLKPLELAALQGKYGYLTVNTHELVASNEKFPLPALPPPELVVSYAQRLSWKGLVRTVEMFAPSGGRYCKIRFKNRYETMGSSCRDLDKTMVALHRLGIRTKANGCTWRESTGFEHQLHITEQLSTQLVGLRDLLDLSDYIVELNTTKPEQVQAEWPTLREKLHAAKPRSDDWQDLMLCCPRLEGVAQLAAEVKLLKEQDWKVRTGNDLAAVALMLPHAQPLTLNVTLDAVQQDVGSWKKVVLLRKGDLMLRLAAKYDVACDAFLVPLLHSRCRCRLIEFSGLITSLAGLEAIVSVIAPTANLHIWLNSKFDLKALDKKCRRLVVHTRSLIAAESAVGTKLLPSQPPPELEVEHVSRTTRTDVVYTVQTFAPANYTYGGLKLFSEHMSYGDVDETVVDLQRWGIRTVGDGQTYWQRKGCRDRSFRIHITDELPSDLPHL